MSFLQLRAKFVKNRLIAALIVTTSAATNIANTTADGNGEVVDTGTSAVTERGFVWSTNAYPTTADSKVTSGTGLGVFTATMTSLIAGTTYHYRAYAINADVTAYGADTTFVTTGGGAVTVVISNLMLVGVGV